MHKAATALITVIVVITALLAGAYVPVAAHDVAQLERTSCTTDHDCELDALRSGTDRLPALEPAADGGEGYTCPRSMELYDTEMPDLGAWGVVCRPTLMEV